MACGLLAQRDCLTAQAGGEHDAPVRDCVEVQPSALSAGIPMDLALAAAGESAAGGEAHR